jgi:septation ring formation regulator EzrA
MVDNDNGKIEAMSHQLVVIQTQMEQMVSFMARQTDAMERLARIEEREAAHTETVRRIWVELERQARLIEEQDKRIDELEKELNKRIGAIEQELTRHGVFTSGAQAVLAVLLSAGVSLAVGLMLA